MATLKGLIGNPTIEVAGKARAFTAYGLRDLGGAFLMSAGDTGVFTPDGGAADSISIVTQPAGGRAVARSDGRISLDFNDDPTARDETVVYDKTVGGETTRETLTLTLAPPKNTLGWDPGRAYNLETDSDNATIADPPEVFRVIYVADGSGDGVDYTWYDLDAIRAKQGTTNGIAANGYAAAQSPANGESWYYGDDPSRPVSQSIGERIADVTAVSLSEYPPFFGRVRLLFKRGDTFTDEAFASLSGAGESALHPNFVGSWGDPADPMPLFTRQAIKITGLNYVMQDIRSQGGVSPTEFGNLILDNIWTDGAALSATSGNDELNRGFTMRRIRSYDSAPDAPREGNTWAAHQDRQSGAYFANTADVLVEDIFIDRGGWNEGYRADKKYEVDGAFYPKPPDIYSQNMYTQTENLSLTFRNFISTRGSLSALQVRAGGIVDGFLSLGNNAGLSMGPGWYDSGETLKNGQVDGNWSMMNNTVHSWVGLADTLSGQVNQTAGGHTWGAADLSIQNSLIINSERPAGYTINVLANDSDLGPGISSGFNTYRGHRPYGYGWSNSVKDAEGSSFTYGSIADNDLIVSNWGRSINPDENVGDVPEATRDALHIGLHADTLLGTSGAYLDDFCDHLRMLDAPWDMMQGVMNYFLDPFGRGVTMRAAPQTVTFQPNETRRTPGIRADIGLDWSTGDLPGTVAGDSIDLDGHRVHWNMTPKNSIANLTFGAGGALVLWGGALKPTGAVNLDDAGNALALHQGAKFHIDGYAGVGALTLETIESRFLNTGTVLGGINVTARHASEIIFGYDDAAWTAASGDTITIYGHTKNGFDGAAGGAASLTLDAGSTLRFLPSAVISLTNNTRPIVSEPIPIGYSGPGLITRSPRIFSKEGSTITGLTSGATGTARLVSRKGSFIADDLTGAFQDEESFSGEGLAHYVYPQGDMTLGDLNKVPDVRLGVIREVRTGINGTTAPNVASTVNLGGTLHVDVTALPNGTYTLIDVDTVTGTFDAVTAAGNGARDLTIAITGTTVTLTVATGTGQISGGT